MKALSPHIGPYDIFAIEYGYRWYGKQTPEEEKGLLQDFLAKSIPIGFTSIARHRIPGDAIDPRAQNEDLVMTPSVLQQ